jgi:hypothetical protein
MRRHCEDNTRKGKYEHWNVSNFEKRIRENAGRVQQGADGISRAPNAGNREDHISQLPMRVQRLHARSAHFESFAKRNPMTGIERYEYETIVAIPPKPFSAYEREGWSVYGISKTRDEVTLKLRRAIRERK